ncbi:MAG: hypothetical protein JSS50_02595 [Proteobacteria bacterium]|nr:hypothetical protein [Pseudomonadota bacterium]
MQQNTQHFSFEECLSMHGIPQPPRPIVHGRFTRWGPKNRYYAIRVGDGIHFGDWGNDIEYTWFPQRDKPFADAERKAHKAAIAKAMADEKAEKAKRHEAAAIKANYIWQRCEKDPDKVVKHPYLVKKQVQPHGIGIYKQSIVIPIMDIAGNICSLQ